MGEGEGIDDEVGDQSGLRRQSKARRIMRTRAWRACVVCGGGSAAESGGGGGVAHE